MSMKKIKISVARSEPRNTLVEAMNKRHASSRPMKDRREKRANNPKNRDW